MESRGGGGGGTIAEMGEEDDNGCAGGCAWEDDGFAGVGVEVVSNGNGRVDSSKTWPLHMRQSATARQRELTRKTGRIGIAQSMEHWILLQTVILFDKGLAVGAERRVVVDVVGFGGSPHEVVDQIEAPQLPLEVQTRLSVQNGKSAPYHTTDNKTKAIFVFACSDIMDWRGGWVLFATGTHLISFFFVSITAWRWVMKDI